MTTTPTTGYATAEATPASGRADAVPPMTADELAAAMELQARKVSLHFEADLATTILEDTTREPGAMPLLQHALRELWERRHGRLLTAAEYREVGGVAGAIAATAEAVFGALTTEDQERVRDIFVRLARLDEESAAGGEWRDTRRRVALVPQFHDNHVVLGTFVFNVLLGRSWPPTPDDLADANRVCRALGLGELLDRMPAGLMQMVGETGWQLSHGERSRLYLARALLQGDALVILDESFAALDPETLEQALRCALGRAPTLLVIAHP